MPDQEKTGISRRDLILDAPLGIAASALVAAAALGPNAVARAQTRSRQRAVPGTGHNILFVFVDQELKLRQRYLDLIMSEEAREVFFRRSDLIRFVRRYLVKGFALGRVD